MPSVLIVNGSDMVRAGDELLLKCEPRGIPWPKTRWLWQGLDVKSMANFEVSFVFLFNTTITNHDSINSSYVLHPSFPGI